VYGGALRVFAQKHGARLSSRASRILDGEVAAGLDGEAAYVRFAADVKRIGAELRQYLETARTEGRTVVGYGAPARSVVFLNTLAIGPDLLPFTVDRASAKQGRMIPGVRIPIRSLDALDSLGAVDLLVLTWNLVDEIRDSLPEVVRRGGRFLVAVPDLAVVTDKGRRSPH
jgi:hypothetical protein